MMEFSDEISIGVVGKNFGDEQFIQLLDEQSAYSPVAFANAASYFAYLRELSAFAALKISFKLSIPSFVTDESMFASGDLVELVSSWIPTPKFYLLPKYIQNIINTDVVADSMTYDVLSRSEKQVCITAWKAYQSRVRLGIRPIYARSVLPSSIYRDYLWTVSVSDILMLLQIARHDYDTHALVSLIVEEIEELFNREFPKIAHAFRIHPLTNQTKRNNA